MSSSFSTKCLSLESLKVRLRLFETFINEASQMVANKDYKAYWEKRKTFREGYKDIQPACGYLPQSWREGFRATGTILVVEPLTIDAASIPGLVLAEDAKLCTDRGGQL